MRNAASWSFTPAPNLQPSDFNDNKILTTISANIPDYLAKLAAEAAEKEKTTVDQIVAIALSAQIAAWNAREEILSRDWTTARQEPRPTG